MHRAVQKPRKDSPKPRPLQTSSARPTSSVKMPTPTLAPFQYPDSVHTGWRGITILVVSSAVSVCNSSELEPTTLKCSTNGLDVDCFPQRTSYTSDRSRTEITHWLAMQKSAISAACVHRSSPVSASKSLLRTLEGPSVVT